MTSSAAPDGRRDNGLPSAEWGALVDVDPRLSEALLASLADEGVPAYVEPATDVDSYTRASVLPKRPLDRLWVDPARAEAARDVVSSEVADLTALLAEDDPDLTAHGLVRPIPRTAAVRVLPPPQLPVQPPSPTDDELFAQIVAGFSQDATDPVPRWPVSEDVGEDTRDKGLLRRRTDRVEPVPPAPEELPAWVEPAALQDEGHFDPPAAPKVPLPRLRTVFAVTVLVLGLAVLFAPYSLGLDDSSVYLILGMLLTGGGASMLVAWMRDAPGHGSGPDDGAVV